MFIIGVLRSGKGGFQPLAMSGLQSARELRAWIALLHGCPVLIYRFDSRLVTTLQRS